MNNKLPRLLAVLLALCVFVSRADAQRIMASLDASAITVTNDVAEATFKVVVKNEESSAMANVWLIFADGFEVSVGDVPAEDSGASESVTRSFDLSEQIKSLAVPFTATLKYSVDGNSVEQQTTVVLHLDQPQGAQR